VFCTRGGAPERGFTSLTDEPVGRYPTVFTTPRTKPLTPMEGVTPKTPAVKTPSHWDGKGVIGTETGPFQSVEVGIIPKLARNPGRVLGVYNLLWLFLFVIRLLLYTITLSLYYE